MTDLTRPIIGIENRTPQEVFDMMCDRFKGTVVQQQRQSEAIKLLFDWCGYNFDKPNTVIAMGVKDIIDGKPHSEKAIQAGVLARQKVAERNRRIQG